VESDYLNLGVAFFLNFGWKVERVRCHQFVSVPSWTHPEDYTDTRRGGYTSRSGMCRVKHNTNS